MTDTLSIADLVISYKNDELLKRLSAKYERYLTSIFDDSREFLVEATYTLCCYFLDSRYSSISDIATDHYRSSPSIQRHYPDLSKYLSKIQLGDKKYATMDVATGAGKSTLMYAVASILLAEGAVKRVLVLCPSLTIESGLRKRFAELSSNLELIDTLPPDAVCRVPRIIDASETVTSGDICIENIHAAYANAGSSISDSFIGSGHDTLVLNDEAHHLFNKTTQGGGNPKKWLEFLHSTDYDFSLIAGFTGTAYVANEPFHDIIFRYSIRQAIDDSIVKVPEYRIEDDKKTVSLMSEAYENHKSNQHRYSEIKPLSLVVTSDIETCIKVSNEITEYIVEREGVTFENAASRVIWVTSSIARVAGVTEQQRLSNIIKLSTVDDRESPVEWIVSVAMLTEGWDVKNVFQIVPHESRAFNSKLLISQVLGRGLRMPIAYVGKPEVRLRVTNHTRFGPEIQAMFEEVIEEQKRIYYGAGRSQFDFDIHQLKFSQEETRETAVAPTASFSEKFQLVVQTTKSQNVVLIRDAFGRETTEVHNVQQALQPLDEIAKQIFARLKATDLERGTTFASDFPLKRILEIIQKNLVNKSDQFLVAENAKRVAVEFQKLLSRTGVRPVFRQTADTIFVISTAQLPLSSVGTLELTREAKIFVSNDSGTLVGLVGESGKVLDVVIENDDDDFKVENVPQEKFKTPLSVVVGRFNPERRFLKQLFLNAHLFTSFVKSTDRSFYEIPYTFDRGGKSRQRVFNPDFIIQVETNRVVIVETKMDNDFSDENRFKARDALEHVKALNALQSDITYTFLFLSPNDYGSFFSSLEDNSLDVFKSSLMESLLRPDGVC